MSLLLIAAPAAATALPTEDPVVRIFVRSADLDLREQLGVRHDFGTFFSTNVPTSVYELLLAQGIDAELVIWHEIQVIKDKDYWDGVNGQNLDAVPADQTPYGIQQIYNNNAITSTSGGAGKVLGHLDTGIDQDHPDLVNRIGSCKSFAGGGCGDGNGHGTHTAGTASADAGPNDAGIWGVAPEATIHTKKVCGNGGFCAIDDSVAAINDCGACHVITFSIGGDGASADERDAIAGFGGLFVAANGNDGGDGVCSIDYPGAFKEANGIASIDSTKKVNSWSSRGCSADANTFDEDGETDFAAAGYQVESTWKGNGAVYKVISGTSMATPHVSGLALKKGNTRTALTSGVEDITGAYGAQDAAAGIDIASGHGLPHV